MGGIHEEDAKERISRHAREAVKLGDEKGTSNIRAIILANAGRFLMPKDRARFDADIAKQRGDFKTAALKYHEAEQKSSQMHTIESETRERFFICKTSINEKQIIHDYIEFRKITSSQSEYNR